MKAKFEKRVIDQKHHTHIHKYKNLNNLPHWHIEHEIIYVNFSSAEVSINGQSYLLRQGMTAFIKSGDTHHIKATADSKVTVIKTDCEAVDKITKSKVLVCPVLKETYEIEQISSILYGEVKAKTEFYEIITDSIITRLTAEIFRNEATCNAEESSALLSKKHKKLLQYIEENSASITFTQAADYINFSQPYFSKYFAKMTGMTFTEYLNIIKVSAAIEQIHNGNSNSTEIAYSCGFGTIRNFNRVFKALTGYSPKKLPKTFVFISTRDESHDEGFIPTLKGSQLIDE
ncbi:MAG: AraC family transcriptional regulator [Acutalibacteraceae bacterium]|nr:AraC family transcriptional regulator [Acutalibacteraceae bacterium]